MGLAKLKKAALILPRIETQEAVSRLAELEWFHPIQTTSEHLNPYFDDLLLKAQRLFQDIDEVIRALGIPLETGVMATMFKGAPKEKTDYVIEDIQDFIADLEDKSKALLDEPKKILAEQNRVSKQLEEYSNVEAALKMGANLNIDLTPVARLKVFYADIFVIDSKDEAEIRKSIGDLPLYTSKLSEEKTSMVVIGSREDSERIIKVMRSFGVHPLQIPANMPQNPSSAHFQAQSKVKELEAKYAEITKNVEKTKLAVLSKILSLHEAARVAKDVLEITRKPGGTENFALIQGYIPDKMEEKFKKLTSNYVSIIEDAPFDQHGEAAQHLPTLLTNKSYTRTFEVITETQGLPG